PWALLFIVGGHLGGWMMPWVLPGGAASSLAWHQLRRLARGPRATMDNGVQRTFRDSVADWAYTAAGAMYMGWTLSLALVLRQESQGLEWVLLALLGTYATDTGAFFLGRSLGRRAMAPTISPGKTWEGAVGGFLTGAGAVVALATFLDLPISLWQGAVLGVLVGTLAQVGDLVESIIKRTAGVKDSGGLIPGHGGMLDRLDSVVFVLVVVYYFFIWTVE
ncbi:MAG: CDP-archaeol synthase, partial [Chloroflexi bacterium]|nr:CDP-archaeol synthase [Chloroflexota bacterium]